MEKDLLETIALLKKINRFLDVKKIEFDSEDLIETFKKSKERLGRTLSELKSADLNDKKRVNELLVYLKLEYDNFLWCFDEMLNAIGTTLISYPD